MARHKDVCPAWAEKVAAKAAEAERQDIVESDTKDIKKKPGPQRWPNYWRCIRYNECFRCEQKGHRWYHFGLCPLKAPSRYVVDYRITLLRPMTISFLDLPPELRDMIYRDACDWNHAVSGYSRLLSNHERMLEANPRKYKDTYVPLRQPLHTPTVLLLNRQIFSEAFEILKKTPLVLRCTSDESELIQQLVRLRSVISLFGTEHMLSRIPVIEIVVDREWFFDGMCFIKHLAYDCLDDDQPKYNHFIVTLDDSVYPDAMATHETFDVHELSLFEMGPKRQKNYSEE
ncbi:hypothetical protein EV356DRAFT_530775 [Viridothelium virens]|uniref:F-box domain-containing protein n=1 Tax=Viridothelium virens TaxID=1048519 RepID=A0A6A6HFR4_VIRVR|nr:hypothetical protein EV356DRAFT_530775 [Viridothelium virens]